MRTAIACTLLLFAACDGAPPTEQPAPEPTERTCRPGFRSGASGCEPVVAEGACPPGTAARLGFESCVPIGPASCAPGMAKVPGKWGCTPILPVTKCAAGTVALLGEQSCVPLGWTACAAPFVPDPGGWGCTAPLPAQRCTGPAREVVGGSGCRAIGDCAAAFPPAGTTLRVNPAFSDAELDATHFRRIQDALDAAPAGAVIAVERGTYAEALQLQRSVTLVGRCPGEVLLDVPADRTGLRVAAGAKVTVRALAIRGGKPAVTASEEATLVLREVVSEGAQGIALLASGAGTRLEVFESAVRDVNLTAEGFSRAVQAQRGAAAQLEDSALSGNIQRGLNATGAASRITANRLVIRALNGAGRVDGARAHDGGQLELTDSVVTGIRGVAVASVGSGSLLRAERARLEQSAPGSDPLSAGALADEGGRLELANVQLASNIGLGGLSRGAGSALVLRNSVVTGTAPATDSQSSGLAAIDGLLEVEASVIRDNGSAALTLVRGEAKVATSLLGDNDGATGFGLLASGGSTLHVEGSRLQGNATLNVQLSGTDASGTLTRTVADGRLGALDGARLTLSGVAVVGCRDVGAIATNAELHVKQSVIHGCTFDHDDFDGAGISFSGSNGSVADTDLAENQTVGIELTDDSTVTVERSIIRGTRQGRSVSGFGILSRRSGLSLKETALLDNASIGLILLSGSKALATNVSVSGNRRFGVTQEDGSLGAEALTVEGTLGDELNAYGAGVLSGGSLALTGALLRDNGAAGLMFDGSRVTSAPEALLQDSLVTSTRTDSTGYGHGVVARSGVVLRMSGTQVRRSSSVGLVVAGASATVAGSALLENTTALHVQDGVTLTEAAAVPESPEDRVLVLQLDLELRDNGTRVGSGELPLPEPFGAVPPPP